MAFIDLCCSDCGSSYPPQLNGVCSCGGFLLARYDEEATDHDGGLWSWSDLLPPCAPVCIDEKPTPLRKIGNAFVKDDSLLPTGTFKARGAAVGVAMARELGASGLALATAGNAGAAWAAYAKRALLPCAVWTSNDASEDAFQTARSHGAMVTRSSGPIGEAASTAAAFASERGWHLAVTFKEPWRVEGKKTALFEISHQLGGTLPDAVVLPVGGGVGAVAWWKAAQQLRAAGLCSGIMRIYAVQSEGCAPIVRAFERDASDAAPWEDARSAAPGIRIASPLAGRLVLRALRETNGGAVAVSEASMEQIHATGLHGSTVCLEAAAAWAGYEKLIEQGLIHSEETAVVYITG
ncbi:MAG: threonine synthase [Actinomycetota bacterium]